MAELKTLQAQQRVRVDSGRILDLTQQLGPHGAEEVVCRAMEELAVRLTYLEDRYRSADSSQLRKTARSLAKIAEQIGMSDVSRVALDVLNCVDAEDEHALAAVMTRLLHVGERSLSAIWDLQDMTMG
ncbi:hypothetical protein SAMN05421688_2423 [Poseidonocella pacifica]|uniref:Hpt domain-containing protein n=1 Tax=Poseidonocella pacifica TaxID=871651 RepID=A0A1I0XLM7_9RHOB|nr:hypothetical protein [Poseidonocella pacifica]SFB01901.1 hypothetical protein SAMN05421688_2423 [Poseidonocella pacifica]